MSRGTRRSYHQQRPWLMEGNEHGERTMQGACRHGEPCYRWSLNNDLGAIIQATGDL